MNTVENGYNCGRQYIFSMDDEGRFQEWSQFIAKQALISFKLHCKHTRTQKTKVRRIARHIATRVSDALLLRARARQGPDWERGGRGFTSPVCTNAYRHASRVRLHGLPRHVCAANRRSALYPAAPPSAFHCAPRPHSGCALRARGALPGGRPPARHGGAPRAPSLERARTPAAAAADLRQQDAAVGGVAVRLRPPHPRKLRGQHRPGAPAAAGRRFGTGGGRRETPCVGGGARSGCGRNQGTRTEASGSTGRKGRDRNEGPRGPVPGPWAELRDANGSKRPAAWIVPAGAAPRAPQSIRSACPHGSTRPHVPGGFA